MNITIDENFNKQSTEIPSQLDARMRKAIVVDMENLLMENQKLAAQLEIFRQKDDHNKKFVSVGKMTGMLAHEIVNPLDGAIRGVFLASHHVYNPVLAQDYLKE